MVAQISRICQLLLVVCLCGCGVAIEIATPMPSPTPQVGFLNPTIWSGDVTRIQATPRLIFSSDNRAEAELFMQPQRTVYILANRSLYMPIFFNTIWYGAPQSTAQLTLNVFRRRDAKDAWILIDSDSRTITTVETPILMDDGLGVGVLAEEAGEFEIRVVVNATLRSESGQLYNREGTNEFQVIVMSVPEDVATEADLSSPFGDLTSEGLLYDYRGWYYGPCAVLEWTGEDRANDGFVNACSAWENQDIDGTLAGLATASEQADWEGFRGFAESMRGLIMSYRGDYDNATIAFSVARDAFLKANITYDFSVALHNLMTTYLMRDERDLANEVQYTLKELRGQFYDEIGEKLTQANLGYSDNDYGAMDDAYYYFSDRGHPQANVIGFWLNK
jgi:hypothetical protein